MQILEAILSGGQKEPWQSMFWKRVQYYKPKASYHQSDGKKSKTGAKINMHGTKIV